MLENDSSKRTRSVGVRMREVPSGASIRNVGRSASGSSFSGERSGINSVMSTESPESKCTRSPRVSPAEFNVPYRAKEIVPSGSSGPASGEVCVSVRMIGSCANAVPALPSTAMPSSATDTTTRDGRDMPGP